MVWAIRAIRRGGRRGLTIIELMVVIGIIVVLMAVGAVGLASIRGADVSATTNVLSGAMRYVYTLAVHHNRTYRLVIDMDNRLFYTEASEDSDDPCARYIPEDGSADPDNPDGAAAPGSIRGRLGGDDDDDEAAARTGRFVEDESVLLSEPFEAGTNVTAVLTEHHTEPQRSGRAAIYFYPTGRAERAMVWVGEEEDEDGGVVYVPALTLELLPLGQVTRHGRVVDEGDFMKEIQ